MFTDFHHTKILFSSAAKVATTVGSVAVTGIVADLHQKDWWI